ncbi:TspO/MBR family protein [Caulobacter sp. 17J80-11]|uniref:TspO/MBR family protein n=1 Tax=Caulobacter sp. 17J80-11 TaxID=2763502 RepID=UPI001653E886|nr:TspO/MBR family protein [Caulobacter sp. 17J80-11]MBC6980276.1 tryptophan-rich sensory protein [Caulobacter sp. 17J80-11]
MLQAGRDALADFLNSRDRSAGHVALGVVLCVGAVALSAAIAGRNAPTPRNPQVKADYDALEKPAMQPPRQVFGLVWPALFSMLTWSGLRIWNARGPERDRAFALWAAIQGLQALWMAWGPRHRLAQLLTALTTLGATAAYVNAARKVDGKAAAMVGPYAGWISFANVLTEELWRKNRPAQTPTRHTVH